MAVVEPASAVALQGSFVLVLGIGGARLASGAIILGDLGAFLLYLLYLSFPLVMVFSSVTELQQGMAALSRVKELLNIPEEPAAPNLSTMGPKVTSPQDNTPTVRFDDVTFGYEAGSPVLRAVSFEYRGSPESRSSVLPARESPRSSRCWSDSTKRAPVACCSMA
jgi:ATP-binding cassette subfamily B protein/ATP-binding cassette subfamily C protein